MKTQNKKFKNFVQNNQEKRAEKLRLKRSQGKSVCVITVPIRKGLTASQTKTLLRLRCSMPKMKDQKSLSRFKGI